MGESSSDADPFMENLITQLVDNFYSSLKAAATVVLEGSLTPVEALRTMLSHHIEGVRVISNDARAEPLTQITEDFIKNVNLLREFKQNDFSLQIEEESSRLRALSQQQRESASKELADMDIDLQRIRGNLSTTVRETTHTTEQIELIQKNIKTAEEMIKRGQSLLARSTHALGMHKQKLEECTIMNSQLQREEETQVKARAEVELCLAQELSLNEAALREQAIATVNENRQVQLTTIQTTLLSRIERPL